MKPTGITTDKALGNQGSDKELPGFFPVQRFVPDCNILNSDYYFWMGFQHCRELAMLAYKRETK